MGKVNLSKSESHRTLSEYNISPNDLQNESLSFFSIPNYFCVDGAQIPLNEITFYQVVQREYIFRPSYKAKSNALKRIFSLSKYEFSEMLPYAAVVTEAEYKSVNNHKLLVGDLTKNAMGIANAIALAINPSDIVVNIAQGAVSGVLGAVGSLVGFEKYYCVFPSGRTSMVSLGSIPPLVTTKDGRTFEPTKKELRIDMPNENTKAIIATVPALMVRTNVDYLFYGRGINLVDVNNAYWQLQAAKPLFR